MSVDIHGWELAYRKRHSGEYEPHEDAGTLDGIFGECGVSRVLDLGCGDGRHLVYFGKRGYEMYGLDIAPTGLRRAEEWLAREGLSAELVPSDMTDILWPDDFFDAAICIQVINHHRIDEIRHTVQEIRRVLRAEGYLFVTVGTDRHPPRPGAPESVEVEPHTYVPLEGHEKGVPHHDFDMNELLGLLVQFHTCEDTLPIHKDSRGYTCVLWQKPAKA